MKRKRFYGKGIPNARIGDLSGLLIVIEGGDGSGRSTQGALLRDWLGRLGYPTTEVGLKRSPLVGAELEEAMKGNTLHPLTLSLFYATDFADQLENVIIPALRAGFVVIADRYIYTLMVRDILRGADPQWIRDVYGMAIVPDMIFYLHVAPKFLAERSFQKSGSLDYWESGMDIQRSGDVYQCFISYQGRAEKEFQGIVKEFGLEVVDGNQDPLTIHRELRRRLKPLLKRRSQPEAAKPGVPKRQQQGKLASQGLERGSNRHSVRMRTRGSRRLSKVKKLRSDDSSVNDDAPATPRGVVLQ